MSACQVMKTLSIILAPNPDPGAQNTRKVGAHGQVTVAAGARWEEQHQHFNIDEYKPQVRAKLS